MIGEERILDGKKEKRKREKKIKKKDGGVENKGVLGFV